MRPNDTALKELSVSDNENYTPESRVGERNVRAYAAAAAPDIFSASDWVTEREEMRDALLAGEMTFPHFFSLSDIIRRASLADCFPPPGIPSFPNKNTHTHGGCCWRERKKAVIWSLSARRWYHAFPLGFSRERSQGKKRLLYAEHAKYLLGKVSCRIWWFTIATAWADPERALIVSLGEIKSSTAL